MVEDPGPIETMIVTIEHFKSTMTHLCLLLTCYKIALQCVLFDSFKYIFCRVKRDPILDPVSTKNIGLGSDLKLRLWLSKCLTQSQL